MSWTFLVGMHRFFDQEIGAVGSQVQGEGKQLMSKI